MDETLPTSPPTIRTVHFDDKPRSRWPKVLGVISLIYAIAGVLCQLCMGSWFAAGNFLPAMWRAGMEAPMRLRIVFGAIALLDLSIGVLMLVGAIRLLQRRHSAIRLLKTWVVGRLTLLLVGLGLSYVLMSDQVQMTRSTERWVAEMAAQNPGSASQFPAPKTDGQIRRETLISSIAFTVALAVYPVFLGTWLSRRKIVEEVETWE